jgi:hypothetical protein
MALRGELTSEGAMDLVRQTTECVNKYMTVYENFELRNVYKV